MSYHYVAKGLSALYGTIVLKIGYDAEVTQFEVNALAHLKGKSCITLFDFNEEQNALLLQQAIPGCSLKDFYPKKLEFVMDSYLQAVRKIHCHPLQQEFPFIDNWLTSIDQCVASGSIPKELLQRAIKTKTRLLDSMTDKKVLHGDLPKESLAL